MSVFHMDVKAEGVPALIKVMEAVAEISGMTRPPAGKKRGFTHYAVRHPDMGLPNIPEELRTETKPSRMIFFEDGPNDHNRNAFTGQIDGDKVPLPFIMNAQQAAEFAGNWVVGAEYGKEPDTDGSAHRGWHLCNVMHGRLEGDYTALVAIAPTWIVYGK